jgi:hypothetical protein
MNPLQNTKLVSITPPAAIVDNASWTTAEIDTSGWDYAQIICYFGAMDIAKPITRLLNRARRGVEKISLRRRPLDIANGSHGLFPQLR